MDTISGKLGAYASALKYEDLPQEVLDSLKVHLAGDLGDVLALTLRGASYREGRLLFETPLDTPTFFQIPH